MFRQIVLFVLRSHIHTHDVFLYICFYAYSSVFVFLYSWIVNKKILCVSFWYEYFIRWNLGKHNCCASSSNHFRFNAFSIGNWNQEVLGISILTCINPLNIGSRLTCIRKKIPMTLKFKCAFVDHFGM